jgi:hypothetical protein
MEEGLPLRVWSQQDTGSTGDELETHRDTGHDRAGHWHLFGFYDRLK